MLFGLELLIIPFIFAVTTPVVLATSAIVAAPAVMLSPLTMVIL